MGIYQSLVFKWGPNGGNETCLIYRLINTWNGLWDVQLAGITGTQNQVEGKAQKGCVISCEKKKKQNKWKKLFAIMLKQKGSFLCEVPSRRFAGSVCSVMPKLSKDHGKDAGLKAQQFNSRALSWSRTHPSCSERSFTLDVKDSFKQRDCAQVLMKSELLPNHTGVIGASKQSL